MYIRQSSGHLKEELERRTLRLPLGAVQDLAKHGLKSLPEYFWRLPASSSGRFHSLEENKKAGLVLHTIRVCEAAEVLMEAWPPTFNAESVRLAAMFHDVGKYGFDEQPTEHTLKNHMRVGAKWLEEMGTWFHPPVDVLTVACNAIRRSHGKFGPDFPVTAEDWIIHLADMFALHKERLG